MIHLSVLDQYIKIILGTYCNHVENLSWLIDGPIKRIYKM